MDIIELILVLFCIINRSKRRVHLLPSQSIPIHVFEPGMCHHFLRPIVSQSILRLSLNRLVHKIYRLLGPLCRRVFLLYLCLFGKDLVPDLLAICTDIRPEPENALKDDNAKCVVVHCYAVIAPAHHFGRHVAWRP